MNLSTYLEIDEKEQSVVKPEIFLPTLTYRRIVYCKVPVPYVGKYMYLPYLPRLVRHIAPRPESASRASFNCIEAINKGVVAPSMKAMETTYILFTPD